MKHYVLKILAVAAIIVVATVVYLLSLKDPIPADLWVRNSAVIKTYLAGRANGRKVLLIGGSNVLFGYSAARIEKGLNIPTFNLGIYAGLPLTFIGDMARSQANPGDIVVFPLESEYYQQIEGDWNPWQLRNAITWNRAALDDKSLLQKILIYNQACTPSLLRDICVARYLLSGLLQTLNISYVIQNFKSASKTLGTIPLHRTDMAK
jgi:hypothetical protein